MMVCARQRLLKPRGSWESPNQLKGRRERGGEEGGREGAREGRREGGGKGGGGGGARLFYLTVFAFFCSMLKKVENILQALYIYIYRF